MNIQPLPFPWEMQPTETSKAFAAFCIYRDLPPMQRSHSRVASETGRSKYWIHDWSRKNDWVERVSAWDLEVDRRQRERFVSEREKMAMRHAQQSVALQEALMLPARALADKLTKFPQETLNALARMSVGELIHLVVQSTKVFGPLMQAERIARDGVNAAPPPQRELPGDERVAATQEERMLMIVEAFEEAGIAWPSDADDPEEEAKITAIALTLRAAANGDAE